MVVVELRRGMTILSCDSRERGGWKAVPWYVSMGCDDGIQSNDKGVGH